jgi:hypothetical protein
MTVTVEVTNPGSLNLLKDMENLGLIHVQPSAVQETKVPSSNDEHSYRWLRGCCKDIKGGSVDNFLAHSREDKEYELAIEKRQEEERKRLADAKLHS